jgi:hypothetical protein
MRVQVDEAGGYDQPSGIDDALGTAKPGADSGNLAICHRHIADCVHPAGRIHHPATRDYQASHVITPAC